MKSIIALSSVFLAFHSPRIAAAQSVSAVTVLTNGASYVADQTAPGSIAVIFGTNLSTVTAKASGAPLPTALGGVIVRIGSVAVPLYYVSPGQINFQVPNDILNGLPTNRLYGAVTWVGSSSYASFPFTGSLAAPGVFMDSNGHAVVQNQDFSLNSAANPAAVGSYVTVYLTGIGAVDSPVTTGNAAPAAPLSNATTRATVTVGGVKADLLFLGLTPGFVGLAQANFRIPDVPPGSLPLLVTVGAAVSNPVNIDVSGGSATSQYLFTSLMGSGVAGSPSNASSLVNPGTIVSYGYTPAAGFSGAVVEIDGVPSSPKGSLTMNADRWLWAHGQPASGSDFTGFITAPADPTLIPYPRFYTDRRTAQTVRVADPYCAIEAEAVAYPLSYLGSFPMPPVTGAPLPASILRGISLKDYWGSGLTNPNMIPGCSGSMHSAFNTSLARVQRLGADHVHVTTWETIIDANSATPVFDHAHPEISDSELSFIAGAARTAGLDVWLDINIPSTDSQGRTLNANPTRQWTTAFLDSYTQFIVQAAQSAEKNGVRAIPLNWFDYSINLTGNVDVFVSKMLDALAQVRKVFHGKVFFFEMLPWDSDPSAAAPLYNAVDAILLNPDTVILNAAENQAPTFALVKQKYKAMFGRWAQKYAPFSKPLVLMPMLQSHRDFLQVGWIEDGFCVKNCVQESLQTDFSIQAIAYEALFEAAAESGLKFLSVDPVGYWHTDVILPNGRFPNTSQSFRNKPAKAIIQHWFKE